MKTSANTIVACFAIVVSLWSSTLQASSPSLAVHLLLGAATVGETAASTKEADELLAAARKAMGEGNLQLADSYISRAERLNPQYKVFHLGDTPAKVRNDLQKKQQAAKGGDKPASRFMPFGQLKPAPKDPFASREAQREVSTAGRESGASPAAGASAAPRPLDPQAGANASRATDPQQKVVRSAYEDAGPQPLPPAGNESGVAYGATRASYTAAPQVSPASKQQAVELTRKARSAILRGDLGQAEQFARQAKELAPDAAFTAGEDRPAAALYDIQLARQRQAGGIPSGVVQAGGANAGEALDRSKPVRSVYDAGADRTRNIPATATQPLRPTAGAAAPAGQAIRTQATEEPSAAPGSGSAAPGPAGPDNKPVAVRLIEQGERALAEKNPDRALQLFREAYALRNELDPASQSRLQTHLQLLSRPATLPRPAAEGQNLLEGAANAQQMLAKRVAADVTKTQTAAKSLLEREPKKSLQMLQEMRGVVEQLGQLEPAERDHQLRRLDISLNETQQYLKQNAAQIEIDEQNNAVRTAVERSQSQRAAIDDKLAALVDEFNRLNDEQRYAEAMVVAKRAQEMDPENPIVVQLTHTAKMLHRLNLNKSIAERKENGFVDALIAVDEAAIPVTEDYAFPSLREWNSLTKRAKELEAIGSSRRSPRERQIESKLTSPVLLKLDKRPLREVLDQLEKLADINIFLDPQGAAAEGVTSDTPVSINLSKEISLKSALLLILEPLRMSYVIENDVLKVTSGEMTHGKVYTKSYPVADLIIPIPNFVPDGREGIGAALDHGYRRAGATPGFGGGFGGTGAPSVMVADNRPGIPAGVNAQNLPPNWNNSNNGPATGVPQQVPFGPGPGGLGGGSQADFDSLIDLITQTIAPTTWDQNGGPGSVAPFETNLTLVVSQTQEIHEQIADLLQQLRRLQDLQVTIEVRFITLSDNFFERIGVDFDFNIDDNVTQTAGQVISSDQGPSVTIGLDPAGNPTPNLDLQFRQGSFTGGTVPTFPGIGFDPATAGTFGFAILSDIEAFFLIQAAQGDTRSNILQAPKVTLFNGQQAFISDTSQRPFVTSIIPVVGDFAVAQQPVIVVLNEGTALTVQAVVSSDRRFVRLTVVPFFSQIGDVDTFTFSGSKTTSAKSSDSKAKDDASSKTSDVSEFSEGTTVQLPTFSFVTVTTTVSVPDGGTVLLGGIKRLSEGRNERGIPILSKIPYISRLFKNVGIGRTTTSLMMMVTPRIIIQEEEEEKLIGTPVP